MHIQTWSFCFETIAILAKDSAKGKKKHFCIRAGKRINCRSSLMLALIIAWKEKGQSEITASY